MIKKLVFFVLTLFIPTFYLVAQPKIIAHRGFWKCNKSAENSIEALIKANTIGVYGSEFDVRISKDSILVINHNPQIWGYNIADTPANTLKSIRLANGEGMPSLKDFFEAARPLKVKLIIELKKLQSPEIEQFAIDKILNLIEVFNYQKRVEFISFSLSAIKDLINKAPHIPTYYLRGDLSPQELHKLGCTGLSYRYSILKRNPQWIKEAHKLGLKVNCWTINKKKDMQSLIDLNVDFITTDEPLFLRDLLNNSL